MHTRQSRREPRRSEGPAAKGSVQHVEGERGCVGVHPRWVAVEAGRADGTAPAKCPHAKCAGQPHWVCRKLRPC
jgi:hypothetical protein